MNNLNGTLVTVTAPVAARKPTRRGRRGGKRVQAARARRQALEQAQLAATVAAEAARKAAEAMQSVREAARRPAVVASRPAGLITVADVVVARGQRLRVDEALVQATLNLNFAAKWQQATRYARGCAR